MKITSLLLIGAVTLASGNLWAASGRQDSIDRLQMSSDVLYSIMAAPDKGIPEEVVNGAKCIVVIPHLGGFVIGAEHGRGIASCDSTVAVYGRDRSFRNNLSGRVRAPRSTTNLMNAIAEMGRADTLAEMSSDEK